MKNLMTQFWNNEDGVTAIEYALIGVAMAVVVGAAFSNDAGSIKSRLDSAFDNISNAISGAAAAK
ncbi:hypothetical protein A3K86_13870 [Photobacterium jeanii]|uniref:Fimbrial protein n=1 Tax=Photobacterium jeanii TaxID=858640 RepID=A0A178K8K4_9GAMM|nr:Flp family type IVb pilin [Photobacterium jeanii]OAN13658.1 hypothetical protein A3K86_13870 [Photobacterium jeanii]PST88779.1 Flp family type IVb pilin [Photobacterium jeanii]